ncbi:hypothetical protein V8C86DRAFT_3145990 [Haematococcus lacustris]
MNALFQIILAVAIHRRRPAIPMDCPPGLRLLINACWREDPRSRPSSREVVARLDELMRQEAERRAARAAHVAAMRRAGSAAVAHGPAGAAMQRAHSRRPPPDPGPRPLPPPTPPGEKGPAYGPSSPHAFSPMADPFRPAALGPPLAAAAGVGGGPREQGVRLSAAGSEPVRLMEMPRMEHHGGRRMSGTSSVPVGVGGGGVVLGSGQQQQQQQQ